MEKVILTKDLEKKLSKFGDIVSKTLIDLSKRGIDKDSVKSNYPTYLSEKKGNLTFINSSAVSKVKSPYHSKSRQEFPKPAKVISRILKKEYIDSVGIKSKDLEEFTSKWKAMHSGELKVVELKGKDILKAFNYTEELSYSGPCSHYTYVSYKKDWKNRMRFYTNNKNVSAVVLMGYGSKGENTIEGRAMLFKGKQLLESSVIKKGEICHFSGRVYGRLTEHKEMIKVYLRKKKNISMYNEGNRVPVVIKADCRFKKYVPMDNIYIDPILQIVSNKPSNLLKGSNMIKAYAIDLEKWLYKLYGPQLKEGVVKGASIKGFVCDEAYVYKEDGVYYLLQNRLSGSTPRLTSDKYSKLKKKYKKSWYFNTKSSGGFTDSVKIPEPVLIKNKIKIPKLK